MKWIRRKPSWKLQFSVALASILFLGLASYLIVFHTADHELGMMRSIEVLLKKDRSSLGLTFLSASDITHKTYRVVETEGRLVVRALTDADYKWYPPASNSVDITYYVGHYTKGFWAPTRQLTEKVFVINQSFSLSKDGIPAILRTGAMRSHQESEFAAQAALVAQEGLDPRLAAVRRVFDTKPIWQGFVINSFGLLAICALVWLIAWVPVQIRDRRRVKRKERGLCPMCKYDVSATPDRCPECGWGHEGEGNGDVSGGNGA